MTDSVSTEATHKPSTMPSTVSFHLVGLDEEFAKPLARSVAEIMGHIGRIIDLKALDGVTIAADYAEALTSLDRGYETNHVLTPSNDVVVGVAMTPSVLRDGELKSHIVLNGDYVWMLGEFDHEHWQDAFHILAHECAHVDVTAAFDRSFPNTLLRTRYDNLVDHCLGEVVSACWDEYAACRLSAGLGADRMKAYTETVVNVLPDSRGFANQDIIDYRTHGDHELVLRKVVGKYGNLMKYCSYMLGHLDGKNLDLDAAPAVRALLVDHWFEPFFERLWEALRAIGCKYGSWTDRGEFDNLRDLIVDILADGGIELYWTDDGGAGFQAPFTPDTLLAVE